MQERPKKWLDADGDVSIEAARYALAIVKDNILKDVQFIIDTVLSHREQKTPYDASEKVVLANKANRTLEGVVQLLWGTQCWSPAQTLAALQSLTHVVGEVPLEKQLKKGAKNARKNT